MKQGGKLLKFSRGFWATALDYKGAHPEVLRDYDVLSAVKAGKSYAQIAVKFGISKMTIIRIVEKYR